MSTPQLRILHVLDHSIPLHSGYAFRTRAILREQVARGWETCQLTGAKQESGTELLAERVDELLFHRTPTPEDLWSRLPILNQWAVVKGLERRLLELCPKLRPDILHAHSPALNGLAALRVGRRLGIPVVYEMRASWEDAAVVHGTSTEGGPRYRLSRVLETHVLKGADAVTTICEGLRDEIVARGVPARRVTVIPNAVDIQAFDVGGEPDQGLRQALDLENATVLGFIGSFYRYEGLELLVRALAELRNTRPELRLLLVGGGYEEENLKTLTRELGVDDLVRFTGRVPHGDVQRYYDLVDLLVYPRLPTRLTDLVTPLKPLEAMAQGRLLMASDVGGHRELIRDGQTGWLFESGSVSALASKIQRVLCQDSVWSRVRSAGRAFVESERNWRVSVARYESVYGAVLNRGVGTVADKRSMDAERTQAVAE